VTRFNPHLTPTQESTYPLTSVSKVGAPAGRAKENVPIAGTPQVSRRTFSEEFDAVAFWGFSRSENPQKA
ncbi:MAG: hypothetical protein VKJ46_06585, partial [Leptolyngbyaceae bacterium]|nr:hypothetical protein [Leptolyngbyaceae bacterium]